MNITTERRALSPTVFDNRNLFSPEVPSVLGRVQQYERSSLEYLLYGSLSPIKQQTILRKPVGYSYEAISSYEKPARNTNIGYFGPHPSDMVDFLGGTAGLLRKGEHTVYELLLTEGEKGVDHVSEEVARKIRRVETKRSAELQGITLAYLKAPEGGMLQDGDLLSHLDSLTYMIKGAILSRNLGVIFAPAPELDHPDHIAVHLAVIRAVTQLAQDGYFKKRGLPALYVTDPEFGFASGGEWAQQKAELVFPGKYSTRRGREQGPSMRTFMVDTSSEMYAATQALYQHRTQMMYGNGQPKDYADKIPALKRLLGMEIESSFAERFRQVHVPGVTSLENRLLGYLPFGTMYQLKPASRGDY